MIHTHLAQILCGRGMTQSSHDRSSKLLCLHGWYWYHHGTTRGRQWGPYPKRATCLIVHIPPNHSSRLTTHNSACYTTDMIDIFSGLYWLPSAWTSPGPGVTSQTPIRLRRVHCEHSNIVGVDVSACQCCFVRRTSWWIPTLGPCTERPADILPGCSFVRRRRHLTVSMGDLPSWVFMIGRGTVGQLHGIYRWGGLVKWEFFSFGWHIVDHTESLIWERRLSWKV